MKNFATLNIMRIIHNQLWHVSVAVLSSILLLSINSNAEARFMDKYIGVSPMTNISGNNLFYWVFRKDIQNAMRPRDYHSNTKWNPVRYDEKNNFYYFTECYTNSCSENYPDAFWIIGENKLHIELLLAEKTRSGVYHCRWQIDEDGPLAGYGYRRWLCEVSAAAQFPAGTPTQINLQIRRLSPQPCLFDQACIRPSRIP